MGYFQYHLTVFDTEKKTMIPKTFTSKWKKADPVTTNHLVLPTNIQSDFDGDILSN
ncbi:hypothetical protein LDI01_10630 [Lentilactobacillus diolivorans]|uniref:Uncharacterized protein n=2 Tax=Lentilactobacillus diolivorans TaxID=179838 RepID=A0A0R1S831_9LACO|nr:hypothetical protein FC85_GL001750 [Lentilactobacillus diolivorans DSM 14421]GEP23470.1 hypothetical protein LDI01_10630 [Lentilactobacillus diolivorans]